MHCFLGQPNTTWLAILVLGTAFGHANMALVASAIATSQRIFMSHDAGGGDAPLPPPDSPPAAAVLP